MSKSVAPDQASHQERETAKDMAIGKQHATSNYPAISDNPKQPKPDILRSDYWHRPVGGNSLSFDYWHRSGTYLVKHMKIDV